ncbi:uncharacterized protein LOC116342785 [Contarinia nasturtii]|uniref:uncharacterized protein LOC116342785 n=1 Tax=Contarinia nasturtii TaxID=265458 RepID=UPI0012D44792|nr:uncharacterized protein LOC116342785 [Contarinia nasturtii]
MQLSILQHCNLIVWILLPSFLLISAISNETYNEEDELSMETTVEMDDFPELCEDEAAPILGIPSIGSMPAQPNVDPSVFLSVLSKAMDLLQEKLQDALMLNELGSCPQIKPINIFLEKNPYINYQDLLDKNEGLEALKKLVELRSEVNMKMPGV